MPSWLDFSNLFREVAKLNLNWFDFLAVVLFVLGLHLGNKSGASKQALSFAQWFGTLLGAALLHPFLGDLLASMMGLRPWAARLIAYLIIAPVLLVVGGLLRSRFYDRVSESVIFGKLEYILGPLAAAVRNVSVLVLLLAVLHGIEVNPAAEKKNEESQQEGFGMRLYPTPGFLQTVFFKQSFLGRFADEKLGFLLVTPPTSSLHTAGMD